MTKFGEYLLLILIIGIIYLEIVWRKKNFFILGEKKKIFMSKKLILLLEINILCLE